MHVTVRVTVGVTVRVTVGVSDYRAGALARSVSAGAPARPGSLLLLMTRSVCRRPLLVCGVASPWAEGAGPGLGRGTGSAVDGDLPSRPVTLSPVFLLLPTLASLFGHRSSCSSL